MRIMSIYGEYIIYASTTLDIAKLDPGAYKVFLEHVGKQLMKEKFGRKINIQQQQRGTEFLLLPK